MSALARRGLARLVDPGDYAGCYAPRRIPGSGSLSLHAWGLAVDLNASRNPQGSRPSQDRRLVRIMERARASPGAGAGRRCPTACTSSTTADGPPPGAAPSRSARTASREQVDLRRVGRRREAGSPRRRRPPRTPATYALHGVRVGGRAVDDALRVVAEPRVVVAEARVRRVLRRRRRARSTTAPSSAARRRGPGRPRGAQLLDAPARTCPACRRPSSSRRLASAARRNATSAEPPIRIGGPPSRAGGGPTSPLAAPQVERAPRAGDRSACRDR